MSNPLRILVLEGQLADFQSVESKLRDEGLEFAARRVETEMEFREQLRDSAPDLILADYSLKACDGLSALSIARRECPAVPLIFVSDSLGDETAIEALKCGAADCVLKGPLSRLGRSVQRALREAAERRERQEAEESALQASEGRYRALFEDATEGVYQSTPAGRFTLANPALARMLGYASAQELIASVTDIGRQVNVDIRLRPEFKRLIGTRGKVQGLEFEARRKDGTTIWVSENARAVRDKSGAVLYYEGTLEDISEDKRVENALRESEERFRRLSAAAYEAVVVHKDGLVLSANDQYYEMFGYKPEELLGKNALELTLAPEALQSTTEGIAAGSVRPYESIGLKKDGTRFPLEIRVRETEYEGRTVRVAALMDISERRRSQEALRDSEALYRSLVENLPQQVFRKDLAGRFTFGNGPFCRSLGKSPAEIVGKTDRDFYLAPLAEKYQHDDQHVMETGQTLESEEEHRLASGKTIIVHVVKTPLRDAAGRTIGVQGIFWDITRRKRTEVALHDAKALYHSLVEHIPQCVYRKDLEGRFTYANGAFCVLLGKTAAEIVGKAAQDLFPPELADRLRQDDEHVVQKDTMLEAVEECQSTGKRKTVFHVIKAPVRNAHGEIIGVQGILTDITRQRELEARYLRAQRLENVGSLASGIAHDLNNILTPIVLCVPMLRTPLSEQEHSQLLSTLERSTDRAVTIIKQLLCFGRGKEGQKTALLLGHLIHDTASIARETFPRSIRVEEICATGLWPVVADATQLHQVLLNLCVNARDAMHSGGKLTACAENILLDEHFVSMHKEAVPGPFVRLKVVDTGTGIPDSVREHIFDSFFSTKPEGQGTGLGLTTVLGIVRDHKGFLTFSTLPGKGTTFEVYLPAAPGAEAEVQRAQSPKPVARGHGEFILVVDDEPAVCDTMRRTLEHHGYVVLHAYDGVEALAQLSAHRTDVRVVITDVVMPLMDGVTLCRTLRVLSPRTPIIVSTGDLFGKDGLEAARAFQELDIRHILLKPYNADALLDTLDEVLAPPARTPGTEGTAQHP